ncbi:hypothetical protein GQ457_14G012580 [Hibiscus cannabinus]
MVLNGYKRTDTMTSVPIPYAPEVQIWLPKASQRLQNIPNGHQRLVVKLKKQVNTVHVRDQKHELTPPRDRYPCDNGYKEVTAFPPRDIVYDQDIQLIGLRDKSRTQQDALPKSESPPRFLLRQRCLYSRHPLCHPV